MTIIIGCDHGGLKLAKKILVHLHNHSTKIINIFPQESVSVDYPDYASLVCKQVLAENALGILICGSGIGMSIAANKIKGIRAALCTNEYMAKFARKHNNANVLCLGERVIGDEVAMGIIDVFLENEFEGGRHKIRVDKVHLLG